MTLRPTSDILETAARLLDDVSALLEPLKMDTSEDQEQTDRLVRLVRGGAQAIREYVAVQTPEVHLSDRGFKSMEVVLTYLQEVFVTVDLDTETIVSVTTEGGDISHGRGDSAVDGTTLNPVGLELRTKAFRIAEEADWPVWER